METVSVRMGPYPSNDFRLRLIKSAPLPKTDYCNDKANASPLYGSSSSPKI